MEFINSSVILARITIWIRTLLYVGSTSPAVNTRWAFEASGECGFNPLRLQGQCYVSVLSL